MNVSAELAALLQTNAVRVSTLVYFDFASGPIRVWAGFGEITAGGNTWSGLGELGAISEIEIPANGNAPTVTFTLSGVDPSLLAPALAQRVEVYDRTVQVFLQHFDASWIPVGDPLAIYTGRMSTIRAKAPDAASRVVEVTSEWEFTQRAIPAFGSLSDTDQKVRAPGDRGCEFVASMQSKTVYFPQ